MTNEELADRAERDYARGSRAAIVGMLRYCLRGDDLSGLTNAAREAVGMPLTKVRP